MKRNTFFKLLLSFVLAAALCMAGLATAYAAGDPITGDEQNPAQAAVAKVLNMPVGTTTPVATFTFLFTKTSLDGATNTDTLGLMPTIPDMQVSFTGTETGTEVNGIKTVTAETDSIFAGLPWPHAGVYVYAVTEQQDSYTGETGETMTYSQAGYSLVVYVENGTDGGLFVAAISAVVVVPDNIGQAVNDKVDPTPTSSALTFTNTFLRNNGGPEPTDSVLTVSKTVAGAFANQSLYFTFNVTLTNPATIAGVQQYRAYVLEGQANVVTSADNADGTLIQTDEEGRAYIEIATGDAIEINLKHGQRLSFTDAPVGTGYEVTEQITSGYTQSLALVVNGVASTITGTTGVPISTGSQLVGESVNSASVTNTRETITPTGISLESLPYILMLALAVAALGVFIGVKLRRRAGSSGR